MEQRFILKGKRRKAMKLGDMSLPQAWGVLRSAFNNFSEFARKATRLCFYLVVLIVSSFLAFMVLKSIVHMFVWIQGNWDPVFLIF